MKDSHRVLRCTFIAFIPLTFFAACAHGEHAHFQERYTNSSDLFANVADKPFHKRVDISTVQRDLHQALADARSQIDEEIGQQEWTNIDAITDSYNYCSANDRSEGRSLGMSEGLTFTLQDSDFYTALEIVKKNIAPLGFTEVVDSSNSKYFSASIYSTADGGWVRVGKAKGKGMSLSFETGCRPLA